MFPFAVLGFVMKPLQLKGVCNLVIALMQFISIS